ncbi:MAG: carboxypeptidase-like regulatory domain-containing protein [Holophagaceae bacterium]
MLALLLLALPALAAPRPQAPAAPPAATQPAPARDALKESIAQAKALWTTSGDRDGAVAKFEMVLAALEPRARTLDAEALAQLCETYAWLAVLDDRVPEKRPNAARRLESLIDLAPDYDIDRSLATSRLAAVFDALRASRTGVLQFTFQPEGGSLAVDGRPMAPGPSARLSAGAHTLAYSRPGYETQEVKATVAPGATATADFKLTRVSSTLTVYVHPSGAEVLFDGRPIGRSAGKAGPELAPLAEPLGLKAEDFSAAFVIGDVKGGRHTLELRAPCFKPVKVEIAEKYTSPFADHTLAPFKLDPSKGTLTVTSASPGGELFLNGQSHGPLPQAALSLCSGSYDLVVKFPQGGYAERLVLPEDRSVKVEARPKPRLAILGIEGSDEFPGRARLAQALAGLAGRLAEVACLPARENETPAEALLRLQASRDAELTLVARPLRGPAGIQVELVLATLDGEEQRFLDRPLDNDPVSDLVLRMNRRPPLWEPSLGVVLLDVAGFEPGPHVLDGDPAVMKEGIRPFRSFATVNGKPVPSVRDLAQVLAANVGKNVQVTQMGVPSELRVDSSPLEIPLNAPGLAYPFLLADLKLKALAAKGDEQAALKLNQAIAAMHFRRFDKALELLREARFTSERGVSAGTVQYYMGICLLRLGSAYTPEAINAFNLALKHPLATLFGPDGPLVAPLAQQALDDLKP